MPRARRCAGRLVDSGDGSYDVATVEPFIEAANRHRYRCDLGPVPLRLPRSSRPLERGFCRALSPIIASRWAASSTTAAKGTCFFTPVNEPSFLAFAGGEKGLFPPYCEGRGWDLKVALCRAAIAGHRGAMGGQPRLPHRQRRPALPRRLFARSALGCRGGAGFQRPAGIPGLGHARRTPAARAGRIAGASRYHRHQLLLDQPVGVARRAAARRQDPPARRGRSTPRALERPDLLGLGPLWRTDDHHRDRACRRPARPMAVRGGAGGRKFCCAKACRLGGVCLYPILGMPEWHEPDVWTPMGLWDPVCTLDPSERLVCEPMRDALASARHLDWLLHRLEPGSFDAIAPRKRREAA